MPGSLQSITSTTKKILEILGGIILFFICMTLAINLFRAFNPPAPAAPTVEFGKLSKINFPPSITTTNLSYSLDTLSGQLPNLQSQIVVYKIQQPQQDLLALDKAKAIAANVGFKSDPQPLSQTEYQWTGQTTDLSTSLKMNINTQDYFFSSNYLTNQSVLNPVNLPSAKDAQTAATEYFNKINSLPNDIDKNKTKTTLLSISFDTLTPSTSVSSAQIIRVEFFQKDVNKIPVFYPNPSHSLIYALIFSSSNAEPEIAEAQFIHKNVAGNGSTYPLKTTGQAFTDLKNGNAYVASFDNVGTTVNIQNVVLGYYMSDLPQDYLMPVIVFEGDHNFTAYVSAISDEWVNK